MPKGRRGQLALLLVGAATARQRTFSHPLLSVSLNVTELDEVFAAARGLVLESAAPYLERYRSLRVLEQGVLEACFQGVIERRFAATLRAEPEPWSEWPLDSPRAKELEPTPYYVRIVRAHNELATELKAALDGDDGSCVNGLAEDVRAFVVAASCHLAAQHALSAVTLLWRWVGNAARFTERTAAGLLLAPRAAPSSWASSSSLSASSASSLSAPSPSLSSASSLLGSSVSWSWSLSSASPLSLKSASPLSLSSASPLSLSSASPLSLSSPSPLSLSSASPLSLSSASSPSSPWTSSWSWSAWSLPSGVLDRVLRTTERRLPPALFRLVAFAHDLAVLLALAWTARRLVSLAAIAVLLVVAANVTYALCVSALTIARRRSPTAHLFDLFETFKVDHTLLQQCNSLNCLSFFAATFVVTCYYLDSWHVFAKLFAALGASLLMKPILGNAPACLLLLAASEIKRTETDATELEPPRGTACSLYLWKEVVLVPIALAAGLVLQIMWFFLRHERHRSPCASRSDYEDHAREECAVCFAELATKSLLEFEPCRHRCVCASCNERLTRCPLCRSDINSCLVVLGTQRIRISQARLRGL